MPPDSSGGIGRQLSGASSPVFRILLGLALGRRSARGFRDCLDPDSYVASQTLADALLPMSFSWYGLASVVVTMTVVAADGLPVRPVPVDEHQRVAPGVWAVGDLTGKGAFTHVAMYHVGIVLADSLGEDHPDLRHARTVVTPPVGRR